MATKINTTKYEIKHENENDWAELPIYPTKVTGSDNVISRSWNDVYGNFVDTLIAAKLKVNWIFEGERAATAAENFFYGYIRKYYKKLGSDTSQSTEHKTRRFKIRTWCPGMGFVEALCYLGTPTTFDSEGVAGTRGASTRFELHWIEIGDSTTYIGGPTVGV